MITYFESLPLVQSTTEATMYSVKLHYSTTFLDVRKNGIAMSIVCQSDTKNLEELRASYTKKDFVFAIVPTGVFINDVADTWYYIGMTEIGNQPFAIYQVVKN